MDRAKETEDDTASFCGSFSGEAFGSVRRRKLPSPIKSIPLEKLADKLKNNTIAVFEAKELKPTKCNTSFHHLRFVVCVMAGFSVGAMLFLRYVITVAILRMVDQRALYALHNVNSNETIPEIDNHQDELIGQTGEFVWDNEIQQMIMSWYMFAYTIPQVPCSKLANMIGARWAVPMFLSGCIMANALTPTFAYFGWQWVVFLRLINGFGATAILPVMLSLIDSWMPFEEISLGLTFAQVIQSSLMSLQPLISGYLSSIHWSYAFYVPCAVSTLFLILWSIIITDKPETNRLVSQKELDLICGFPNGPQTSTSSVEGDCNSVHIEIETNKDILQQQQQPDNHQNKLQQQNSYTQEDQEQIPAAGLVDILRVPVFYAYLIMWAAYCGSMSVFNFIMPTYLQQFLNIGISHNGFYCAIIQTGCILSCLWPHPCLHILQKKFNLSLTVARRLTHILICSMVALSFAYVGTFHDNQLVFFFINRCFHSSNDVVSIGTIMTNFSKGGVMSLAFSMINTVGNLSVVLFSSVTGYILDKTNQSVPGWSLIFMLGAGCQILMMVLFSTVINSDPIDIPDMKRKRWLQKQNKKKQSMITKVNDAKNEEISVKQ